MPSLANVAYAIDAMAKKQGDNVAIYFPTRKSTKKSPDNRSPYQSYDYKTYTYRELSERSDIYARGLLEYGFEKGDRIALMVNPSLEFFALSFALFKSGIVPILIDPGIGVKNLKKCLDEAAPLGFIGIPKAQIARILLRWSPRSIKKIINVGFSVIPGRSLAAVYELGKRSTKTLAKTDPQEMAAIIFTSGSTGVPKGVVYSHENFVAQVELIKSTYDVREGEIDLPTFPLFALFNPALGMSSVIPVMNFTKPAQVVPENIVGAIKQFNISNMFGSPALLNTLSKYCEANEVELHSLKRVISAGAPVQPKIVERLRKSFSKDTVLYTPYGATESLPVSSVDQFTITGEGKVGFEMGRGVCIGRVCEGLEVHIIAIDDGIIETWNQNLSLPANTVGEIIVKGKNVTKSYFNREHATELAKISDGEGFWHRMGDVGYFDSEGRLWFCGRKGHRVSLAAQTLYSVCCEGVFNAHRNVYRSALIRLVRNGVVCAGICIELETEFGRAVDPQKTIDELKVLAKKFSHTEVIEHFYVHPSFPVDIRHNAKIDRDALARWARGQ